MESLVRLLLSVIQKGHEGTMAESGGKFVTGHHSHAVVNWILCQCIMNGVVEITQRAQPVEEDTVMGQLNPT